MRIVIAFLLVLVCGVSSAANIPRAAYQYKRTLIREARHVFGLDAPVAVFAAQIHQESVWKANAVSYVGAQGLSQFMPSTEKWMNQLFPGLVNDGGAMNPTWSIRAMIRYDHWLLKRVRGESFFDKVWAALRSYNGGLGHWQTEARNAAPATDRASIDAACGTARRHNSHCLENLGYPHRIMNVLQPRYASWGPGVYQ